MNPDSLITTIEGIGNFYQKKLHFLGIKTIKDLLMYFPARYDDFSKITDISDLKINERTCIKGEISRISNIRTRGRGMFLTQAVVNDDTGSMKIMWFNQPFLTSTLKDNDLVCLAGKIVSGKGGVYLSNPIYEKISDEKELTHAGRIVPVYRLTTRVSSRWFRFVMKKAMPVLRDIKEPLPKELVRENNLMEITKAIKQMHFPDSWSSLRKAQERFAYQEVFLLELFVLKQRVKRMKENSISIPIKLEKVKKLVESLPFSLTISQKKAVWQILKDMEKTRPMSRLLQGDVGSGKTIVAALAALNAAKNQYQVAFMAPTEILAKQHFETVHNFLKDFNVNIGFLTSKNDKYFSKKLKNQTIEISKAKLLEKTLKGEIDIIIGTHSLIQKKVKFKKLGLVIVDEQHRFGVEQRSRLIKSSAQKGLMPHLLSMTATPIPRTLALTIYGDLDISILDQMPRGPRDVETNVVTASEIKGVYSLIRKEINRGRQAFVICPRIEKKEIDEDEEISPMKDAWSEVAAVEEEYEKLSKEIFPEFNVAMMHGKLGSKEKERIMKDFKNKKTDILVSTSVIEVGIDIPNATIMIVEGADRFGLAQLHQFRGRIGRSGDKSYFLLFPSAKSKDSIARLESLVKINDGLTLAESDLKFRGPGDFSGVRQWGIPDMAMESLKDIKMIEKTRNAAKAILEKDWRLKTYPLLEKELERFNQEAHME
ncbi:MAG: ATP-dependent DNA helicase RecG [Candidatus Pacebacteria bacterium]|nr:ATP-dependent DNA helicase RecG [Candidatus Paceibacterota bacterium]